MNIWKIIYLNCAERYEYLWLVIADFTNNKLKVCGVVYKLKLKFDKIHYYNNNFKIQFKNIISQYDSLRG